MTSKSGLWTFSSSRSQVVPVDVAEGQVQPADEVGVQALGVQHLGNVVDRRCVGGIGHRVGVDVAHQRDLALDALGDRPVGSAHQRIWRDTHLAQGRDRVLGGFGLQLTAGAEVGHQRDVQEEGVLPADLVPDLPGRLEERQRLDVADGAADLGDHHVDVVGGHREDAVLDLVGDVRDHLHGVAEVLAATLAGDHVGVDLPGGDVGLAAEVAVEEPLVVADVEVGLGAVLGDEHLTVLERVHRAGIDVEVGVQLLHGDPDTSGGEQCAEARGGQPLADGGGDASGDEDMLFHRSLHGLPPYWSRAPFP